MATESIQGLRYPLPSDPNDPPADIKNLADDVVGRLVMRFPTEGARNAALPSPVDGMVCFIEATSVYQARVDNGWQVLYKDTGWTTMPIIASGISGTVKWRARGADVEVDCVLGSSTIPTGATNLTASGLIPAEYLPAGNRRGTGLLNANPNACLYVGTTGVVGIINSTGGVRTGGEGTVKYFAG